MVSYQALFFAGPKAGEHQDALADARFAQLDAFVRAGDAEPFGAGFLQRLGNWDGAQAVSVRLHHREYHALQSDVAPDYAQVLQDGLERNFRPDRASLEMDRFAHRYLECQTPLRRREENPE